MKPTFVTTQESERLRELYAYNILDTQEEKDFNDLVMLAAQLCGTPISTISLVDKERVWFKASTGASVKEGPRTISFCSHAIDQHEVMIVNDLTKDDRFKNNPLVAGSLSLRFYAGVQLISPIGLPLGTICVIDTKPKVLTDQQLSALKIIAKQVMNLMNMRLNIHHLQNAKRKISENETRFKSLAQGSPVGIFQTDARGKGTYVNQKWCEIVGVSEAKAYDIRWVEAIHEEDRQKFLTTWARAFSCKGDFNLNFRFQNRAKGIRWVKSKATPFYNEQKVFMGYVGTLEDITERKMVEVKLRATEKLFHLISSNSKDLLTIFEANEEARCIYVSPSCREILGYEPEELIGLSPFEMMPPEQAKILKEDYLIQILKGQSTRTESQLRKSDGTFIWVEALSKPIYNEDGKILSFQSCVREISERKKFEVELKAEKERAEESAKAKSLFLSTMSHEIRTPMNAVIGLTNLLIADNPRADQVHGLQLLKFSGENLLTLINDILDYNKIEAGKMELETISFDVKSTIQKFIHLLKSRAEGKGIELNLQWDENIPAALIGDPVRFGQVLNNLVGNAIKFTERGSVMVTGSLLDRETDSCRLRFAITDTGIGIEEEKLERIFENFSQAGNDIARKYGGTGLGLSISKKLLQLMGSEIKVTSEYGKGTEFYFELNLKVGQLETRKEEVRIGEDATYEINILLVEDNKINQVVAANFLRKWGMNSDFANNGLEAITMIQEKSYDLVLMDLQMPEMDGYEAVLEIRKMDDVYFKTVPILALTASVLPEIKEKAMESGFDDFVAKPFQPQDLKDKILHHVSIRGKQLNSTLEGNTSVGLYAAA